MDDNLSTHLLTCLHRKRTSKFIFLSVMRTTMSFLWWAIFRTLWVDSRIEKKKWVEFVEWMWRCICELWVTYSGKWIHLLKEKLVCFLKDEQKQMFSFLGLRKSNFSYKTQEKALSKPFYLTSITTTTKVYIMNVNRSWKAFDDGRMVYGIVILIGVNSTSTLINFIILTEDWMDIVSNYQVYTHPMPENTLFTFWGRHISNFEW